jgi:hypothetical protein
MPEILREGVTIGAGSSGKRRGRPKKLIPSPLKPRPRGRPAIDIRDDPDRHAVVVMQALRAVFDVQERAAAVRAVKMVGASGKAETIRFKARKTLHEKQRAIDEAAAKGGLLTGRQLQQIRGRQRWLQNLTTAATLCLNSEIPYTEQLVERVRNLAQLAGEMSFFREFLERLLARKAILWSKYNELSDT